MNKLPALIVSLSVLTPVAAHADAAPAAPPPPEGVWTGKGQAGYLASQGNTDAKSANAAIDMALTDGLWTHAFHIGGLYGKNTGIVSAERWDSLWQSNYSLTKDLFVFGGLRYAHDLFSGFEYQASVTTGLGYKFIDSDTTKLSAEAGVGYRKSQPEVLIKDAAGEVTQRILQDSTTDVIALVGVDYSQALSSTTTLTNKLRMESGSSNTLVTDALALAVKMSSKLALSLGYGLQNNTHPPMGLKKLDTVETVNLVYSF